MGKNKKKASPVLTLNVPSKLIRRNHAPDASEEILQAAGQAPPVRGVPPVPRESRSEELNSMDGKLSKILECVERNEVKPPKPLPKWNDPHRRAIYKVIHDAQDLGKSHYVEFLEALDGHLEETEGDYVFRKWKREFKIHCWMDVAKNKTLLNRFHRLLSEWKK